MSIEIHLFILVDRGYQFADGVYEVFAVINEKIVDFDEAGYLNH